MRNKEYYLHGIFNLYFTEKISIPLELRGLMNKKEEINYFYYDLVKGIILENEAKLYIYQCQIDKGKDELEFEMHFRFVLEKEEYKIKILFDKSINSYYIKGNNNEYTSSNPKEEMKVIGSFNLDLKVKITKSNFKDFNDSFIMYVGDKKKEMKISIEKEKKEEKFEKFKKFPYKTLINDVPTLITDNEKKKWIKKKKYML